MGGGALPIAAAAAATGASTPFLKAFLESEVPTSDTDEFRVLQILGEGELTDEEEATQRRAKSIENLRQFANYALETAEKLEAKKLEL